MWVFIRVKKCPQSITILSKGREEIMITREILEAREAQNLKPYACFSGNYSRKEVQPHPYRTEFQRDRDRIIHSKSFRRLEYKTQVFLTKKGDHLRTRLTHSLEVSQLARTVASLLSLNCDLVEAISLGHDVGHTPFGHAGEIQLRELLAQENIHTFKHNAQSVKILEMLEKKYIYDGLKITLPVLEGIYKHTKLPRVTPYYCQELHPDQAYSITLEGQVVAITDEIAQVTHDLDDYLRYNILEMNDIMRHPIFDEVKKHYKDNYKFEYDKHFDQFQDEARKKDTIIRCLVDFLVSKLAKDSKQNIEGHKLKAWCLDKEYIVYDEPFGKVFNDFQGSLQNKLFSNYKVKEMDIRGKAIVQALLNYYKEDPEKRLPLQTFQKYVSEKKESPIIVIADYISGMTDRYALDQYEEIISLD